MASSPCLYVASPQDSSSGEFSDRRREIVMRLHDPVDPLPGYAQERRNFRDSDEVVAHGKSIVIC